MRLLDQDRKISRQRLDDAIRHESEWEATKRAENLRDLMRMGCRVAGRVGNLPSNPGRRWWVQPAGQE